MAPRRKRRPPEESTHNRFEPDLEALYNLPLRHT
jgi:hypothetical protein